MDLISFQEVDELLVALDKKKCPWCDGCSWVLRGVPETDITSTQNIAGLRGLPAFRIFKEDGNLQGSMTLGTENALPLVAVRCEECGFVHLFDYFKLVELAKLKKQKSMERENGKA